MDKKHRAGRCGSNDIGEEKNCKAFIQWCHQGPEAAKVDEVIVKETAPEMFEEFSVIRAR